MLLVPTLLLRNAMGTIVLHFRAQINLQFDMSIEGFNLILYEKCIGFFPS